MAKNTTMSLKEKENILSLMVMEWPLMSISIAMECYALHKLMIIQTSLNMTAWCAGGAYDFVQSSMRLVSMFSHCILVQRRNASNLVL